MGTLVEGIWHKGGFTTSKTDGRFLRSEAACRNWVTRDGSPGPTGKGGFKAEAGRYLGWQHQMALHIDLGPCRARLRRGLL